MHTQTIDSESRNALLQTRQTGIIDHAGMRLTLDVLGQVGVCRGSDDYYIIFPVRFGVGDRLCRRLGRRGCLLRGWWTRRRTLALVRSSLSSTLIPSHLFVFLQNFTDTGTQVIMNTGIVTT
jgi:hypothetical protein